MTAGLEQLQRIQKQAFTVGLIGLTVSAIGAFLSPQQFFHSYLFAYVFWIGIALGSLAILMLHHLSGGAWGLVIRRLLESAAQTLPLMAILFLPLLLGLRSLYIWARPEVVAVDEALQYKSTYLNVAFFLARTVFYFAVWIVAAHLLNKWSLAQDNSDSEKAHTIAIRSQRLSGPGLLLYVLTMTFASVDWVMSLDPHWLSTIFGILIIGGQVLGAFSFIIVVTALLVKYQPFSQVIAAAHLHDLGKLLLAFVMLWAYFALSQFLIIWSGNLPEETPWYVHRLHGGWQWIGLTVVVLHFALPFFLLLPKDVKRNARRLAAVAGLVVFMRMIDLFWMVAPEFNQQGFHLHWLDLAIPIGLGGIWLAAFIWRLRTRPLLPTKDPYWQEALEHGHH
ncbi:MAG: hypothetical protein AB1489_18750 [Acidobacteriota bacterium]